MCILTMDINHNCTLLQLITYNTAIADGIFERVLICMYVKKKGYK